MCGKAGRGLVESDEVGGDWLRLDEFGEGLVRLGEVWCGWVTWVIL